MNKVLSIHYLRGIAALLVVGFHLRGALNNAYAQSNLGDLLFFSGASGVDIFFIISGFIITLSTSNNTSSSALIFAIKRFFRVYPVFIVILIIYYILISNLQIKDLIKSILFIPQSFGLIAPFFGYNVLLPAWTLTYEVYFYLIFMIALSISHKYRVEITTLLLLIPFITLQIYYNGEINLYGTSSANLNDPSLPYGFLKLLSSPMLIEFVYGMLLYKSIDLIRKIKHTNILIFFCVSFFFCAYASGYQFFHGPVNFGLWAIVLIFGTLSYELNHGIKENKALNFLGDISYSLYLVHSLILDLFTKYEKDIFIYNMGNGVAKFVFTLSACILISYFVFNYIEKPAIKIGRSICNKFKKAH